MYTIDCVLALFTYSVLGVNQRLVSRFFPLLTVTFTLALPVFAGVARRGQRVPLVSWEAVGRVELRGRGGGRGRGAPGVAVHVAVDPGAGRHAPRGGGARGPRVARVLLGQVAVVVVHLVYRRLAPAARAPAAAALPAPIMLQVQIIVNM